MCEQLEDRKVRMFTLAVYNASLDDVKMTNNETLLSITNPLVDDVKESLVYLLKPENAAACWRSTIHM